MPEVEPLCERFRLSLLVCEREKKKKKLSLPPVVLAQEAEAEEEVKKKKPVCVREGGPPAECLSEPCVKARLDVHTRGKSWKPDWTPGAAKRQSQEAHQKKILGGLGGGHGTRLLAGGDSTCVCALINK